MNEILVAGNTLKSFMLKVLLKAEVREDVAHYLSEGLTQTSLRGVDSHGVRLFPHYLRGVRSGRINPKPNYKFSQTSPSTGLLNGDHTFGHAAGMEGAKRAVELASLAGTGHIAVYNSSHFGAAAYYALEIARHDMIGMSFTHTDSLIKTHGGTQPFLGNNPICVAVPCEDEDPFCLDMATSVITFNKVRELKEQGLSAPLGVGANNEGIETTDPNEIKMLMPIGGYKGYGLSMLVEILCSLLTGMPYGPHIPKMFEAPLDQKRFLGHFFIAVKIASFQDVRHFKKRFSHMIHELRHQSPHTLEVKVQVPGDPEKKNMLQRSKEGIPVKSSDFKILKDIALEYGISLDQTD